VTRSPISALAVVCHPLFAFCLCHRVARGDDAAIGLYRWDRGKAYRAISGPLSYHILHYLGLLLLSSTKPLIPIYVALAVIPLFWLPFLLDCTWDLGTT
jgi:Zn-dependent protease